MLSGFSRRDFLLAVFLSALLHGLVLTVLVQMVRTMGAKPPDTPDTPGAVKVSLVAPAASEPSVDDLDDQAPDPASDDSSKPEPDMADQRRPEPLPDPEPVAQQPAQQTIEPAVIQPSVVDRSSLDLRLPGARRDSTHPLFSGSGERLPRFDVSQPSLQVGQNQQGLPSRSDVPMTHQATQFDASWRDLGRRDPYQALIEDSPPLVGYLLTRLKVGPITNPNCPMYMELEDCQSPFPTTR